MVDKNDDNVICPLFFMAKLNKVEEIPNRTEDSDTYCLEENCAWWKTGGDCCSILDISFTLHDILRDMPED